jgi:hypothetical protein
VSRVKLMLDALTDGLRAAGEQQREQRWCGGPMGEAASEGPALASQRARCQHLSRK